MPRKRHRAWSNSEAIGLLDRGFLQKKAREKCVVKTATKKKTKSGKVSYSGTKWLKGTQCRPQLLGFACVFLHRGGLFSDPRNSHCVDLQELPDSLRPPGAKDIAEASPKKEHRPETSN